MTSKRPVDPDVAALRLLTGIAETGSLGAAARSLGIAQPNASRTLRRLERDLRLSLVDRGPRGSTLTAEGRLVADWAAGALTALDRLLIGVESLRVDAATNLRVGASLTIGEHLAPGWLSTFRAEHPDVHVQLRVMNSAEVLAAVTEGDLDLGFVESPGVPAGLRWVPVARDELVVIVAPAHPWGRRASSVSLDELAATPLVVREEGSGTRRTVEELLAGRPADAPLMECSSTQAIVHSVAAGAGPAIVSTLAIAAEVALGRVVVVPIAAAPAAPESTGTTPAEEHVRRDLRAVWRPSRRLTGAASDFVAHARAGSGRPR